MPFVIRRAPATYTTLRSIRKRFRTYQETTMPVIDFFRDDGRLQEIDCTGTIDEVFELACAAVDSANSA